MESSFFSRRFPGQFQGAFVLCSLLAPGTCFRQIYWRTHILVWQNLYRREVLSFKVVVLRDNRYISSNITRFGIPVFLLYSRYLI